MKKLISSIIVIVTITLMLTSLSLADSGQNTRFKFNTFQTGTGLVDGSTTGHYYSLTPGGVHLSIDSFFVTNTNTGERVYDSSCFVELKRDSYSYGTGMLSNSYSIASWNVGTTASNYYIIARGVQSCTYRMFDVEGKMHDHSN